MPLGSWACGRWLNPAKPKRKQMPDEQKSPNVSHQIMKEKLMGQSHSLTPSAFLKERSLTTEQRLAGTGEMRLPGDGHGGVLPLPQLRAQLREARHANALLRTEVEMLEKRYRKMEPGQLLAELQDAAPKLAQTHGRYKSKLQCATDYSAGLTVEQKCELAERELSETKDEIQRMKEDSEKTLQYLEAVIEEADIWCADVQKAISDFEKDIVSTISSKKGSIRASDKLLRYMEEKNRQRDLLRQKLRFKNSLLKGDKKKLQQQLKQKEQMGETFLEFRLQQLQVRNAQYQQKIAEKNQELLQLKLTSEKTVRVLNFYKTKLQDAMATSASLMKDISQRKELLEKTEREAVLVEEQWAKAESVNRQLQKQLSDYSVPPVLSYVWKKMAVTDLEKSLKAWERKVAIAEMSLQSYRRAWKQVVMSACAGFHQGLLPGPSTGPARSGSSALGAPPSLHHRKQLASGDQI
ncbi:cilia- and flagella-associated protein 263-like [Opisthocomus hoazin]|uniref:cilia- and flagella-associated protein 263-like n=1 Tax=Opisthocomus hoazin TaxID=30419 RepID=UPI003F53002F